MATTTKKNAAVPRAAKQPQDRKPKEPAKKSGTPFTHNGKNYSLPPITEEQAGLVPSWISDEVVLNPDDVQAQYRLAVAMLRYVEVDDETAKVLREMPTAERGDILERWMGESEGSSGSSPSTEEPSNTTGAPDSEQA